MHISHCLGLSAGRFAPVHLNLRQHELELSGCVIQQLLFLRRYRSTAALRPDPGSICQTRLITAPTWGTQACWFRRLTFRPPPSALFVGALYCPHLRSNVASYKKKTILVCVCVCICMCGLNRTVKFSSKNCFS